MPVKRPELEDEPVPAPRRKGNQTSWRKGQSGNAAKQFVAKGLTVAPTIQPPKALAKGTLEALRAEINKFDPVMMRRLKRIVQSPYFNKVRPEVVIRACELLLAYEYGRPKARSDERTGDTVQDFLAFLTAAQTQARLLVAAGAGGLPPRPEWQPKAIMPPGVTEADKGNGKILDATPDETSGPE